MDCPICDHPDRAEIDRLPRDHYQVRDGKRVYWTDRREPTYQTIARVLGKQGVLSAQTLDTVTRKVSRHFREHVTAR